MAKNIVTKKSKKEKNKIIKLINRLEVMPDLRVGETKPLTNRIKYFLNSVSSGVSQLMLMNILFVICLTPILVLLSYQLPLIIKNNTSHINQIANFGMAIQAGVNPDQRAWLIIYDKFIWLSLYLIPCIAFLGIPFSGLLLIARNKVWKVQISLMRQFFRGIKKYGIRCLLGSSLLSLILVLVMYSIVQVRKDILLSYSPTGHIVLAIFSCLILLLFVMFSQIYYPMMVAYKFTFKQRVKNSFYLLLLNILPIFLVNLLLFLPLLLMFIGTIAMIVFGILFLTIGFIAHIIAYTLIGNYTFDKYIRQLYQFKFKKEQKQGTRNLNKKDKIKLNSIEKEEPKKEEKVQRIEIISEKEKEEKINLEKEKKKQNYIKKQNRIKNSKK